MRSKNKSKVTFFLLGLSFIPDFSSESCQGLSCSKTGSPTGSQLPSVHSHILQCGGLHELLGNLCSGTWSILSPPFCSPLGVCRVVSFSYSLLFPCCLHSVFLPLLRQVITRVCDCLKGSALASGGSLLELAGLVLSGMGKASGIFSQTPFAASVPSKPCQLNHRQ